LRKVENTVRYTQVRSEEIMYDVLGALRDRYPEDWLFALGSFHPSRLANFQKLNVWGDYKGWIFQYEKRNGTLNEHLGVFASNHLQHVEDANSQETAELISDLQEQVRLRNEVITRQKDLSRQIFEGRRTLKTFLTSLYQEVSIRVPEMGPALRALTSRGLLDDGEERHVVEILKRIEMYETEKGRSMVNTMHENRDLKIQIERLEGQLNAMNISLAENIARLLESEVILSEDTKRFCHQIAALIERTERSHRFEQVRDKIVQSILNLL
jgi:hypothetical protein